MRFSPVVLLLLALASVVLVPHAVTADIVGVEGKCCDIFCTRLALDVWQYDSIVQHRLAQLIPCQTPSLVMQLRRFHGWDSTKKTYYFAAASPKGAEVVANRLWVVDIQSKNVTSAVSMNSDTFTTLEGLHYDQNRNMLWAIYQNNLCLVNPSTGDVNLYAQMWDPQVLALEVEVSTYNYVDGLLYISVHDIRADVYRWVAYNVVNKTLHITGEVGHVGFHRQVPQYVIWDQNMGKVISVGDSTIQASIDEIDPIAGTYQQLMTSGEPEMENWDVLDWKASYGSLAVFDADKHSIWVTLIDKSSGQMQTTDIVRFDLQTKLFYDATNLSKDATNYAWLSDSHPPAGGAGPQLHVNVGY